jgi:hypothetical protein
MLFSLVTLHNHSPTHLASVYISSFSLLDRYSNMYQLSINKSLDLPRTPLTLLYNDQVVLSVLFHHRISSCLRNLLSLFTSVKLVTSTTQSSFLEETVNRLQAHKIINRRLLYRIFKDQMWSYKALIQSLRIFKGGG